MGRNPGHRPSHRNPKDLQPECCQLCGALVGHRHLIRSEVEGLRGYMVCDLHPWERKARVTPSHNDLLRMNPGPVLYGAEREEPIGGLIWFFEDEN